MSRARTHIVIPAKAGIHLTHPTGCDLSWTSAFAGVTEGA